MRAVVCCGPSAGAGLGLGGRGRDICPLVEKRSIEHMVRSVLVREEVLLVINDHLSALTGIFQTFGSMDGEEGTLSVDEFCLMLQEARLLGARQAKLIFHTSQAAEQDHTEADQPAPSAALSLSQMDFGEFVGSLARVAAWKWHDDLETPLATKVLRLITHLAESWRAGGSESFVAIPLKFD